jgi:glutathione S-transferase
VFGLIEGQTSLNREPRMKLYDTKVAPNPRRARIFLAEKGISIPTEQVDIAAMQHKTAEYAAINPLQRMPALVLDDGTIITESIAICRYFEMMQPEPPLFGVGPKDTAIVEMWNRRAEINFFSNVAAVFRHTHPAMKELEIPQVPAWADANRPRVTWFLELLDRELAKREFVAGDRYTVADITTQVALDFMKPARLSVPEGAANIKRWHSAGICPTERKGMIPIVRVRMNPVDQRLSKAIRLDVSQRLPPID